MVDGGWWMVDGGWWMAGTLTERRSLVGLEGRAKEVLRKSESADVRWWRELEWLKMDFLPRV
jgi:hypothetical protein